jgi:hypothetical protein
MPNTHPAHPRAKIPSDRRCLATSGARDAPGSAPVTGFISSSPAPEP